MPDGAGREPGWDSVLVAAPPHVSGSEDLATLETPADLIELRLDLLLHAPSPDAVAAWVAASPRPVLATVRSRAEGGAFDGPPADAARLLDAAVAAGAAWVDVEQAVRPHLGPVPQHVGVLASVHGRASDAPAWGLDDEAVTRVKVARPVDDAKALRALRAEAETLDPRRCFLVPYGRLGAVRGAFVGDARPGFLFGSATSAAAVVAGQPRLDVLLDELRACEVGPGAALFGLVGDPPARSPSPALHNAVFRVLGRNALYVPLTGFSLEEALNLPVRGLSVTQPFKVEAAGCADRLGEEAHAARSVNTLVRLEEGGWSGHNTDALALRALVRPARGAESACIYGSGGLARAAVHVLTDLGYAVRVNALVEAEGRALAVSTDVEWGGATFARRPTDRLVLNATPAGADGKPLPAFAGQTLEGLVVVDAPYARRGLTTGLARQAHDDGAAAFVDGLRFLAEQARFQALLFGAPEDAPIAYDRVMALALHPPANLVLVGARGAGKTTVGRRVARLLGRPFVDLDDDIRRATGRTPATWIAADGWNRFREIEHEALRRACARRGIVVAAGGGAVELEANRALLACRSVVVFLRLDPATAAARVEDDATDRPRWPGTTDAVEEARVLMSRRTPYWEALAEHVVDASASPAKVAAEVADCWCEHGAPRS